MSPTVPQARQTLQREWGAVLELLAALEPGQWRTPTRCSDWDVAQLTRHAVWGVSMEADAVRRLRLAQEGRADGRQLAEHATSQETRGALGGTAAELLDELAALGEADPARPLPMPYGDVPLGVALDVFVMEAGIHGDDFRDATGQQHALADDVVASTTAFLTAFLPVLAAGSPAVPPDGTSFALVADSLRISGRWSGGALLIDDVPDPAVTVTGDDTSVLLYALGRLTPEHQGLRLDGDRDLARRFKSFVPGP
ncbi:MAG: hypothetical protein AVDCRST_MAG72-2335 [uncultured Nocardioidaceae bacterium]|uniref:Mycothiol-dependent maleylpyruvate isomerase metal-binding domain-containing protein n=1 Tax=uncultured Nocardioidaceae bacterium TaxID=253824 RepID=A0A6J4MKA7_9ACTN|nr:MAG: hypothetical protein AVDCRST_MAG72-2335 [uncultured Nocardioidaceae bacterium]